MGDPSAPEFWGDVPYNAMAEAEAELIAEFVTWIMGTIIGELIEATYVAVSKLVSLGGRLPGLSR